MSVEQARDAAIVRICDCECTAEVQHASASCRTAGIGKIDALIAAVRAEDRQQISRDDREAALDIAWGAGVAGAWKRVADMYREGIDVQAWAAGLTPRDIGAELREARRLLQLDEPEVRP